MITLMDADKIVRTYLEKLEPSVGEPLEIMESETIERPFGWVFFYNSRSYRETKRFEDMLLGNTPLIVDRTTAQLHVTGTAEPIEYYIAEYEARHGF